jgi:tetratricopeptide (TPR) repeat protein
MNKDVLFPSYVPRVEERQIRREAAKVREDGKSRAVLLYGPGGVGKTWLVRELAQASAADPTTVWLEPIDVDDPEYWLLSNLERKVAHRLDPDNDYFAPYLEYLSQLPSYTRPRIGHETVVSHLGRIKRVFVDCYTRFVEESGKTVVIGLDTVETIRGMYLLLTLTQWMKALPATLFILSGRPLLGHGDGEDPIRNELVDPYQGIPVTTVRLGEFSQSAALDYLNSSEVASGLTHDEKEKLVGLTRGHPLWLAFTIDYLRERGIPEEVETSFETIERNVPYGGGMTLQGESLHEAFQRRLVTPYREADFWHEAIKRLAVVRQSVNQDIWQALMADRPLPEGVASLDEAWQQLLRTPWIRPRANRRYVTLHDAVAEELAQRIIPVHDQDQQWRRQLWQRAVGIYGDLAEGAEAELAEKRAVSDQGLKILDARPRLDDEHPPPTEEQNKVIREVARLEARKRELDQFKAVRVYYLFLCDFEAGCKELLDLLGQAKEEHNVLFQDLLAMEMQRFLPGGAHSHVFGDVISEKLDDFRRWLKDEKPDYYLALGLGFADYLIENERSKEAIELLERLPETVATPDQLYHLSILRGNAYMRISGMVKRGLPHFEQALATAEALKSDDRHQLIAKAYKELGFYYRNEGSWQEADNAYRQARDAISVTLSARRSDEDRDEMASIQTNWAYVKGLGGSYRDGTNLVESAITVHHRLKKYQEEGISWSVCGEVYRYERRFQMAWNAYEQAEQIFQGQRNWSWLGQLYQEQAICLFQATHDGVNLTPGRDPIERAKRLITVALDICRDQAVRGYPSALNRAGRIFGQEDFEAGLGYLTEGIDQAHKLSDGWFWLANLIEYVELSYRSWVQTGRPAGRDEIAGREADIMQAMSEYEFPDLRGRWKLLQGHLGIHDWLAAENAMVLSAALQNYKDGFALIARAYVGSSGASAIAGEFDTFGKLFSQLSSDIRTEWQEELRGAWAALDNGSTLLLARLEELF